MSEGLENKVDAFVRITRFTGLCLTVIGSIFFYSSVQALLDPNAVIEISGIPTTEQGDKITAVIVVSLLPLTGLFLSFVPSRYVDKWARRAMSNLD